MKLFGKIDKTIFGVSVVVYLLIFAFIVLYPAAADVITNIMNYTLYNVGIIYVIAYAFFFVILLVIGFSKYGKIKLGKPEDKPEFSFMSWIAMLVGAGIGCGFIFYAVNEPITHFMTSPYAEAGSIEAARDAMRLTMYHWGFLPWGAYTITGLCVAWFVYKRGLPNLISSGFYPMLGDKVTKGPGKIIDAFSLIAVVCGVSMSVGFAAVQFSSGLKTIYGVPDSIWVTFGVVALIAVLGTLTAMKGVEKGIKVVSDINIYLIYFFIAFVLICGSTIFMIKATFQGIGDMIAALPQQIFFSDAYGQTTETVGFDWVGGWTVFYWAWWVAFAPFTGGFLAKISKGRTVKQFCLACVFVPALIAFIWFGFFGSDALHLSLFEGSDIAQKAVADIDSSLFFYLQELPLSAVTVPLAMALIITLIVTSINSGTFMAGEYSMGQNGEPTLGIRAFWGIFIGLNTCLFISLGGLPTLKYTAVVLAFPFLILLIIMIVNLFMDMKKYYEEDFEEEEKAIAALAEAEEAAEVPAE
ncbi:MAG: BCCT family transporter [Firmicutes bacterium]|nr:BCCT family transporter [Bacillota bacterium]